MEVTLNTSESIMIRVSWAVSSSFSGENPPYTRRTSGPAKTYMIAAITSAASANRLKELLPNRLAALGPPSFSACTKRGTSVEVMQELNSNTGR